MKHSFGRTLFAGALVLSLTATPPAKAFGVPSKRTIVSALICWEIASLIHMAHRGSKPEFAQRSLHDVSIKLLKNNPKEWSKNLARNLEIIQTDYFEGQQYKPKGLSVEDEKVVSSEKCLAYGVNGKLLSYYNSVKKATKNAQEIAILAIALAAFKVEGVTKKTVATLFGFDEANYNQADGVFAKLFPEA